MRWLVPPVTIFVVSRILIFTFITISLRLDPTTQNYQPPIKSNPVVQGLTRWDGGWFIRIANDGYRERADTNFFPLFPLMGRYISRFTGLSIPAALVFVANAFRSCS